jgi:hypothetical protein
VCATWLVTMPEYSSKVVACSVHFDHLIGKVSYIHVVGLVNLVFKVMNVLFMHSSMPSNPHEFPYFEPNICFVLLAGFLGHLAKVH